MKALPRCWDHKDCFANSNGICVTLSNNTFYRDCPFYKPESERVNRLAIEAAIERYGETHK